MKAQRKRMGMIKASRLTAPNRLLVKTLAGIEHLPSRVPVVQVSRPVFHLVKYMATKSASARIFLQHLQVRNKR